MRGILLVNLGTPEQCKKKHVQKFIGDMLSDPLVLGQPKHIANFLAKKIIAPLGVTKSLKKYAQIWRKESPKISPLLFHMQQLADALEKAKNIPVAIAMRYGEPNVLQAFEELSQKCPLLHEVIVFPLYPHYAQSTTQTLTKKIGSIFYMRPFSFRLKFIEPYYCHPAYIDALATHIKPYIKNYFDKIVFTYHSLPVDQAETGWKRGKEFDYVYQLKETNRLIIEKLGIPPKKALQLYSSQRRGKWLKPFLDENIGDLPTLGAKHIVICAPGFPIDNMETLYDIDLEARKLFMEAGGKSFHVVPSLNNTPYWVNSIWKIIAEA